MPIKQIINENPRFIFHIVFHLIYNLSFFFFLLPNDSPAKLVCLILLLEHTPNLLHSAGTNNIKNSKTLIFPEPDQEHWSHVVSALEQGLSLKVNDTIFPASLQQPNNLGQQLSFL